MDWKTFLEQASTPNGLLPVIVGVVLSVLVEYAPSYAALAPKWKRAVFLLVCLIVPLLAALLGVLTAGWEPAWAVTWWPALVAGVMTFGSGTVMHIRKMRA